MYRSILRHCRNRQPMLALGILMLTLSPSALADWHTGVIDQLGIGYDGVTVVFRLGGWTRTNCTCYSSWPDQMCLDRTRTSFKEEYAWILRARASNQRVMAHIDETTCKVLALFETSD
jgi:hypothetical protein